MVCRWRSHSRTSMRTNIVARPTRTQMTWSLPACPIRTSHLASFPLLAHHRALGRSRWSLSSSSSRRFPPAMTAVDDGQGGTMFAPTAPLRPAMPAFQLGSADLAATAVPAVTAVPLVAAGRGRTGPAVQPGAEARAKPGAESGLAAAKGRQRCEELLRGQCQKLATLLHFFLIKRHSKVKKGASKQNSNMKCNALQKLRQH